MGIEFGALNDCKGVFTVAKDTTIANVVYLKGAVVDPTVVQVEIYPPNGVKVTYVYNAFGSPIVKVSTGVYTVPVLFDQAGPWIAIWTGSGNVTAPGNHAVMVNERPFP